MPIHPLFPMINGSFYKGQKHWMRIKYRTTVLRMKLYANKLSV
jgi:hypothetical protein